MADWQRVGDGHPCGRSVRWHFGLWNDALRAAGFAPHMDRYQETVEWMADQIRAGVSTQEIADELGITPNAIHMRLRNHGLPVSELRRAA